MEFNIFLERIIICFALSFLIGIERQYRRRYIGLRTTILVCIGAFLFVSFSFLTNNNDITRIAAQVVTGIGFLGAGVILKDGSNVKGLTTAATLWCDAAVGVLCAGGFLFESVVGTFIILFSNIILRFVNQKLNIKKNEKTKMDNYILKVTCYEADEVKIRKIIREYIDNKTTFLNSFDSFDFEDNKIKITALLKVGYNHTANLEKIMNKISIHDGVISFGFKKENIEEIDDEEL